MEILRAHGISAVPLSRSLGWSWGFGRCHRAWSWGWRSWLAGFQSQASGKEDAVCSVARTPRTPVQVSDFHVPTLRLLLPKCTRRHTSLGSRKGTKSLCSMHPYPQTACSLSPNSGWGRNSKLALALNHKLSPFAAGSGANQTRKRGTERLRMQVCYVIILADTEKQPLGHLWFSVSCR